MKKSLISFIVMLSAMHSPAQAQVNNNIPSNQNFPTNPINDPVIYRLFPTQNLWTFIKLNTRNGKMWQVQFDVKENNRLESSLSLVPLIIKDEEKNGRFTLFPTQNIYTFILLDQIDGRVWQVQWSIEAEKRLIIPIN